VPHEFAERFGAGVGGDDEEQRARRLRFDDKRKQAFLDVFAATCNVALAAEAAGVSADSVYDHLRRDAVFEAAFEEALRLGYKLLEAETVAQHRADQERYRTLPAGEAAKAQSFERSMQLLAHYRRRDGQVARRPTHNHERVWTFDEAIDWLDKKLVAFGARRKAELLPPPEGEAGAEG
jgi:hypothetical protein